MKAGNRLHKGHEIPTTAKIVQRNNKECYLSATRLIPITRFPYCTAVNIYRVMGSDEFIEEGEGLGVNSLLMN